MVVHYVTPPPPPKSAFSLVELSIVLVILGLLIGGILSGQSLIRAAELRKVTTDIASITSAMGTFRDKYFALPGDMPNAIMFWGAADAGDGVGADCWMASAPTATCNGDGDGRIGIGGGSFPETYRFWQHLRNAGLHNNNLTGIPASPPLSLYYNDVIGQNVPASPQGSDVGYAVSEWYSGLAYTSYKRQNTLNIAGCCWSDGSTRSNLEGASIKPEEMWQLDTKIDDGKPGFGNVQIYAGYSGCIIDASNYNLSNTSKQCQAFVGLGY
jgi:prepilin-type N-terminal cleavage/methylation domain-containing protein